MEKRKIAALAAILCLSSAISLFGCGGSGKDSGESGSGPPAEQRENAGESRETEQGEPVEWDWSYICLDEEKGIYGRSEFETTSPTSFTCNKGGNS